MLTVVTGVVVALSSSPVASASNAPASLYFPYTYPVNGTLNGRTTATHDGYDMFAYGGVGAPVYASYSGRVNRATLEGQLACTTVPQYGNVVYIDHGNNLQTRYAHLNSFAVAAGDWVTTGQLIGFEGQTGGSRCGAHLHFEIKNVATGIWLDVSGQMAGIPIGGPVTSQSPIGFSGAWLLRTVIPGGTTKTVYYGAPGDVPVTGDWDGDNYDTLGVVRYNSGTGHLDWYLNNVRLTTLADGAGAGVGTLDPAYGDAGDTPIVGDWDGIGGDSKAVVRRSGGSSVWYPQTAPAYGFSFGLASDTPTAGDWDCDNRDSPGITRANAGSLQWYLDNQFGTAVDYSPFLFGAAYPNMFDRGIAGRWWSSTPNCARPVIARNGATEWYLSTDFLGTLGVSSTWGVSANDFGLVSDWDTDSLDDFIALS